MARQRARQHICEFTREARVAGWFTSHICSTGWARWVFHDGRFNLAYGHEDVHVFRRKLGNSNISGPLNFLPALGV